MTDDGYRMKSPAHPGGFVRMEILDAHGLTVTDAAEVLCVTRQALSNLANEKADMSSDMALRIEKAFGIKMDTLMRMQGSFDIAQARKREAEIKVKPFVRRKDPLPSMA